MHLDEDNCMFPYEGNFYAASSRGRYGNAFSVTGVLKHEYKHPMHLTLAGGRLWRKLMSICEHKGHLWNTLSSFFSSGDSVSEVWVLWNALGGVPIRVSVSDTRWHTRLMRWAERARRASVLEGMEAFMWAFSLGKAPLLLVPFLERIGDDHLPPAAQVQRRCGGSEGTEFAAIADGESSALARPFSWKSYGRSSAPRGSGSALLRQGRDEFAAIADGACVARRARALCSRGNGVHSLWAFSLGKAPLLLVPFLRELVGDHCPPRLGSSRCWAVKRLSSQRLQMGLA